MGLLGAHWGLGRVAWTGRFKSEYLNARLGNLYLFQRQGGASKDFTEDERLGQA